MTIRSKIANSIGVLLCVGVMAGCASKVMEYEKLEELNKNEEYDKKLKIKEISPPPSPLPPAAPVGESKAEDSKAKDESPVVAKTPPPAKKPSQKKVPVQKHEPDIEDSEGFSGRRPLVDPFLVGEKITLGLSYFNITAGYLDLEVLPFVEVNGAKSYAFRISAKSNSWFSRIYAVDDYANTYVNYESMLPFNFEIKVRESKQLADVRSYFDWKNLKGNHWEKRVSKDKGERNKDIKWDIKAFSQNVISAIFYLRTFTMTPGKKLAFRVANDGKNIVFKGEVLRREEIQTEIGKLKTVVIKPEFEVDGIFKPVGEVYLWLTDDERKFLVRIESKIKIGTIVGKIKAIEPGK